MPRRGSVIVSAVVTVPVAFGFIVIMIGLVAPIVPPGFETAAIVRSAGMSVPVMRSPTV